MSIVSDAYWCTVVCRSFGDSCCGCARPAAPDCTTSLHREHCTAAICESLLSALADAIAATHTEFSASTALHSHSTAKKKP